MEQMTTVWQLLRASHWSKSLFVLLGVFYAQSKALLFPACVAAVAFCFISSAVYIYNDIQDRHEDSLHPYKKHRPLAADKVSLAHALLALFVLLLAGLILGWMVSKVLALILCLYLMINLAYNHLLKLLPVLDVLCIAAGFMLRVLAGTTGIGLSPSLWLVIAATLLSLFIALNKRLLEMNLGLKHSTRAVLQEYPPLLLQWSLVATGLATFLTYLLYAVYAHSEPFYFILTLPFAAIALWRFAWLSSHHQTNDDPVTVFLSDQLSRINLYCFVILTFMALTQ